MDYDYAKLSPSLSLARTQSNHGVAIIKLAKKAMEQKSDIMMELLGAATTQAFSDSSSTIDIKI